MGLFGFNLPGGRYGDASLSDKLALLGASLRDDPSMLAKVQGGLDARMATKAADERLLRATAPEAATPGLSEALAGLGLPGLSATDAGAGAWKSAMGGGVGQPQPFAQAGAPLVDADGQPDLDAQIALNRAKAAPTGALSPAPNVGAGPDIAKAWSLIQAHLQDPREAVQAKGQAMLKELQFRQEQQKIDAPEMVEGSDGAWHNKKVAMAPGFRSDMKPDPNTGIRMVWNPATGSYDAQAVNGFNALQADNITARGVAQANVDLASQPRLRGRVAAAEAAGRAPFTPDNREDEDGAVVHGVLSDRFPGTRGPTAGTGLRGQGTKTKAGAQAGGRAEAENNVKNAADLPGVIANAQDTIGLIRQLKAMPEVKTRTGLMGKMPAMPGTGGANFDAMHEQLKGKVFMQAFQTLRGGGQITEKEGEKATAALARLNRAQSPEGYLAALNDLEESLTLGVKRARAKVQQGGGAGSAQGFGGYANTDWQAAARAALGR